MYGTTRQIAAVLGHKTLFEVERYTRDADHAMLADEAVDRLQRTGTGTETVKPDKPSCQTG